MRRKYYVVGPPCEREVICWGSILTRGSIMLWVHPVERKYYVLGTPCQKEVLCSGPTL